MPKKRPFTCQEPTESKDLFKSILPNIFAKSRPAGCFLVSTNPFNFRTTSSIVKYLFLPERISSTLSSNSSSIPWISQNFVIGTNFLVSASSNTYVPAPQAKCIESSYFGLLENASMMFVSGIQLGTGNQSSIVTSPFVCSSMRCMQSGIVILYFSLSCLPILPVRETGWKLTACTTSMFFCAYRTMPPSS